MTGQRTPRACVNIVGVQGGILHNCPVSHLAPQGKQMPYGELENGSGGEPCMSTIGPPTLVHVCCLVGAYCGHLPFTTTQTFVSFITVHLFHS